MIAQAFKEFVKVNEKKQQRPSLRQKLKGLQKIVAQNKNRERSREKIRAEDRAYKQGH